MTLTQRTLFDRPIATGAQLRDRGIAKSIEHTEVVTEGWKAAAIEFVRIFPRDEFMTEDVREYAYSRGLPRPPNERAWGGVINEAKRLGLVTFVRFDTVANPRAHRTPASVWKKTLGGRCDG